MVTKKNKPKQDIDLTHIEEALRPLAVPMDTISIDPANTRQHPEQNINALVASMKRFGQQQLIMVDQDNVCVAGSGRLRAAQTLGWNHIAVVRTKLVGNERTAYAIADNRTAELAAWDEEALAKQLESLGDELLESAGYTHDEMLEILADLEDASEQLVVNDDSDYEVREHAAIKQVILTFTTEQYVPFIEALVSLKDKKGLTDFTSVVVELVKEAGYEVP